jgi:hypothetical protein
MSLLILPILAFMAGGSNANSHQQLRAFNGSEVILDCPPAEFLVRTHMAPDFESPQLVRRLDWFQDESLVASFQQVKLQFSAISIS